MNENLVEASPNTVTLSDGRVAVMREITGYEEYLVQGMLAKTGASPQGFGGLQYISFLAVFALTQVGDDMYTPASQAQELINRLRGFKAKDLQKIMGLYNRVNSNPSDVEGNDAS